MSFSCLYNGSLHPNATSTSRGGCYQAKRSSLESREAASFFHVNIFNTHPFRLFPIEPMKEISQCKLNYHHTEVYAGASPPARTKWQKLVVLSIEIDGAAQEPLRPELFWVFPTFWVCGYCCQIDEYSCSSRNFVSLYLAILNRRSWNKKREWWMES
ncbi:hypothetical protein EUGRSUZ_B00188 [Eucalyptus grandis]|uniref:Uncharacterized protein n=2 Tax=Eucalyptus grandis TaxID=71139 RepID=A0ACC3LLB2_EUCGR|nr:hypothetical protein EUGRSUZ_B00188 [Eucalyptus grandis]